MNTQMSNNALKEMVTLLIREFGSIAVAAEVQSQLNVSRVNYLARLIYKGDRPKITRIKVVRQLIPNLGLKEAKEWVELRFPDEGNGSLP